MTKVYVCKGDKESTIRCRGHATGSVEVCSAVSMLVFTLVNSLDTYGVKREIKLFDGYADLTFARTKETDTLYDFCVLGFEMLSSRYSQYIKLNNVNK